MDWKTVIDEAMSRNNLRQVELAAIVGCSQPHISYLRRNPGVVISYTTAQRLLELANTQPTAPAPAGPDTGLERPAITPAAADCSA